MSKTKIEWADEVWNPMHGCSKISSGCDNCYAERMATNRLRGRHGYTKDNPFRVTMCPEKLEVPFRWKKPRRVFVNSMGDLFHENVPFSFIASVFNVIEANHQHIFILLTKRPARMLEFTKGFGNLRLLWPLPNVWLGVSVENQETADERLPLLFDCRATRRIVSCEPLLCEIDMSVSSENAAMCCPICTPRLDWIICGAETGPGKRTMNLDWARSLRDQCLATGVPFFFKKNSVGDHELDGKIWEEFPDE